MSKKLPDAHTRLLFLERAVAELSDQVLTIAMHLQGTFDMKTIDRLVDPTIDAHKRNNPKP